MSAIASLRDWYQIVVENDKGENVFHKLFHYRQIWTFDRQFTFGRSTVGETEIPILTREEPLMNQLFSIRVTYRADTTTDRRDEGQDEEEDKQIKNLCIDLTFDSGTFDRCISRHQFQVRSINVRSIPHQFSFMTSVDDDTVDPFGIPKLSSAEQHLIRTDRDLRWGSAGKRGREVKSSVIGV